MRGGLTVVYNYSVPFAHVSSAPCSICPMIDLPPIVNLPHVCHRSYIPSVPTFICPIFCLPFFHPPHFSSVSYCIYPMFHLPHDSSAPCFICLMFHLPLCFIFLDVSSDPCFICPMCHLPNVPSVHCFICPMCHLLLSAPCFICHLFHHLPLVSYATCFISVICTVDPCFTHLTLHLSQIPST